MFGVIKSHNKVNSLGREKASPRYAFSRQWFTKGVIKGSSLLLA